MKFSSSTNNFTAGEWSEKMLARTDVDQYQRACKELTNFIPQLSGGASFRRGTFVVPLNVTQDARLQTATNWKIMTMHRSNGAVDTICVKAGAPSTSWNIFDINGGAYALVAAVAEADVTVDPQTVQWVQIGNTIIMTGTDFIGTPVRPRVLYYYAGFYYLHTLESYTTVVNMYPSQAMPYLDMNANSSSVGITPSAVSGAITLTTSSTYFTPSHVGARVKFYNGTNPTGIAKITAYAGPTTVSATVEAVIPGVTNYGVAAGTGWQESAWSPYRGWPLTVTVYQERLIFGGNAVEPMTVWGSRIGNLFDFDEVPSGASASFSSYTDDNSRPFTIVPSFPNMSRVNALSAGKVLTILTDRAEVVAYGSNGALGPNDISLESSSSFGAAWIQPVRTNHFVSYINRSGTGLRSMQYNWNEGQYKSIDLSFTSDHLFQGNLGQLKTLCQTSGSTSIVWALSFSGNLYACAMDSEYTMAAWSRITLGGNATVLAIGEVHASDTKEYVHMIVRRGSVNTIERMEVSLFEAATTPYSDATVTYLDGSYFAKQGGSPASTVSGLTMWNGQTVSVIADQFYIGEYTITGGTLTIPVAAAWILVGFKYNGYIIPAPIEAGQQVGSSQGTMKRASEMYIRYYKSYGLQYGRSKADLMPVPSINPTLPMNQPPIMLSGGAKVEFPAGYERLYEAVFAHEYPWPCHILSITMKGAGYD